MNFLRELQPGGRLKSFFFRCPGPGAPLRAGIDTRAPATLPFSIFHFDKGFFIRFLFFLLSFVFFSWLVMSCLLFLFYEDRCGTYVGGVHKLTATATATATAHHITYHAPVLAYNGRTACVSIRTRRLPRQSRPLCPAGFH